MLSTDLARRNPKAYIAHFQRLDPEAQRAWVGSLSLEDHRLHVAVLGESVVLGLVLTLDGALVELSVTLAGGALGTAQGWDEAKRLQDAAFARAESLGGSVTATGLLRLPVDQLERAPLDRLGWTVESLEVWIDAGAPTTWRLRGALPGGGPFWSPAQAVAGPAEAWETRLRQTAERLDARFRVSRA